MSAAASGKTTFAAAHPRYRGYKVVDAAQLIPRPSASVRIILYAARLFSPLKRLARNSSFVQAKRAIHYYPTVFEHIRSEPGPIVVLGRRGPDDLRPYEDIVFGVVQTPWSEHERNCRSRRRQLRNPFPLLHHWTTNTRKVEAARALFLEYARRHDLEVFESFAAAIDNLSRNALHGLERRAS